MHPTLCSFCECKWSMSVYQKVPTCARPCTHVRMHTHTHTHTDMYMHKHMRWDVLAKEADEDMRVWR